MLVVYLLVAVNILAFLWVKKRYNYWKNYGFIGPAASFPFGSVKGIGQTITPAETFDKFYKEYKGKSPAIGIYVLFEPTVLVLDPELYKNIFVRDFASFSERGFYYDKKGDPLSANILALEVKEWKEKRVKLTPIFTSGKMKMMFEIVDSIGERLIEIINKSLESSDSLDMRDIVGKFTTDVIGNVAFGLDCKCLENPNSEFLKHGRRLFDVTTFELLRFFFANAFPDLSRKLGIPQNPREPTNFFHNTFRETFEYREKNDVKRNDFVSLLLGLKDSFTTDELAAEAFLVYAAGFETSSTLISFVLYELSLNPEMQSKLRDEVKPAIEENDGKLTYDMLLSFKYLDQVVNETLRHYPPIPNSMRKCTKDYEIPGTNLKIEKGRAVQLPHYSLQHDPDYYPDPYKFDPERFNPENVKNHKPFTFLPFGEGPRNCIGMRFGLMQSKIAIVKLLQNFEFEPNEKTTIPMKFIPSSPFLSPVGGICLKVNKLR